MSDNIILKIRDNLFNNNRLRLIVCLLYSDIFTISAAKPIVVRDTARE